MDDDLAITLGILLAVDEPTARHIAENLGRTFGTTAGKGANQTFNKTVGGGGGEARASGEKKGKEFAKGFSTGVKQIEDITKAALQRATNAAKQADIRTSTIQRQGTTGGQVAVDRLRREQNDIHSLYSTSNQKILADAKRHNAAMIASDQQSAVRRTVLIRTALNNLTRVNQSVMTAILTAWRSHHQRRIADEQSANRKAEIELQGSMDRRLAKIKAGSRQQSLAATANATASERANTALSGGVLGAVTGRGMGVASLFAGALGGREIFNILGEFQSIETAFKGIFREVDGGAPRTTQFLKDMQAFARETPFTLSQVSLAAQKMFANRIVDAQDIDATEQLTDKLRRLADAAAATGKTAAQMDAALLGITQIKGTGFMMEELRQVTENIGLPMEEVAKSLGMSVAEMKKAMEKGLIGTDEGLDAIFDALTRIPGAAGASARQAKTLRGAMSQLRDVGEQLVIKFLMPVGNAFAAAALTMGKFGDQLISGKGAWKVARDALGGIVGALTAIIAAKGAIQVVKLLGIGLSAIAAAPVTAALVALVGVLSTFDGLRSKLASLVEGTKNWFLVGYRANVVIDSFSGFVKVVTTVGKFARTVQDFTKALVVGTKDWFLVGYRIGEVIDEFSNIVTIQTSFGAAARVIVDALRGIWDAVGGFARTGDFAALKGAIGDVVDEMADGFRPIRDALGDIIESGITRAKEIAAAAVKSVIEYAVDNASTIQIAAKGASVGGLLLRALGFGPGWGKLAGVGLVASLGAGLAAAINAWDTGPASLSLGGRIGVIFANATKSAENLKETVGGFLSGLFTDHKVEEGSGEFGRSIRKWITDALKAGGGPASIVTDFIGKVLDGLGDAFDSGAIARFMVDVPRKIGRFISEAAFSEEFMKIVLGLGAAVGAAAIVVAGQFIRGFLEGLWARRGDIQTVIEDIFNLGFSGGLATDIATRFAQVFLTAFIGFKGWRSISSLFSGAGSGPFAQLRVGFSAGNFADARKGLVEMKRETLKTSSTMANIGVRASQAAAVARPAFDLVTKSSDGLRGALAATAKAVGDATGASTSKAITNAAGGLRHYGRGWTELAWIVDDAGRKIENTARLTGDVIRTRMGWGTGGAATGGTSPLLASINPRQFALVDSVLTRVNGRVETLRRALGRDLPKFGAFISDQAGRGLRATQSMATGMVRGMGAARRGWSNYWAKYQGDATKSQQAISAGMSTAASAFSGYMIGMADDGATQAASITASVGSIAQAFASGGPWLGALSIASTVIGAWWGDRSKEAKKAAEEAKRQAEEMAAATKGFTTAILGTFESVGSSGVSAQATSIMQIYTGQLSDQGVALAELSKQYGISAEDIARAAAGIGLSLDDLIAQVRDTDLTSALSGDSSRITDFAKIAEKALDETGDAFVGAGKDYASIRAALKLTDFGEVGASVHEVRRELESFGLDAETVDAVLRELQRNVAKGLETQPSVNTLTSLSTAMDDAIEKFTQQESIAGKLRRTLESMGSMGERTVAVWDRLKASLDLATGAYMAWIESSTGGARTDAETRLELGDLYQQRKDLLAPPAEGEVPMSEAQRNDRLTLIELSAEESLGGMLTRLAQSVRADGGGLENFQSAVGHWFDVAIAGAADAAEKDWLTALKEQVFGDVGLDIAWEASEIKINGIEDVFGQLYDYLHDPKNTTILTRIKEAPNFRAQSALIAAELSRLMENPVIEAEVKKAGGFQAVLDEIMADKSLLGEEVTIPVGFDVLWGNLKEAATSVLPSFLVGVGVKQNWNGGLETSPVLSTLAERGPEAIFPLTNPARMRQIMGIPQVARAFDAAGFGAPIAGNATGTNYAPVTVDQSQVNHFTIASDTPRATADQIVRRQRSARFLGGHTLPVVIR